MSSLSLCSPEKYVFILFHVFYCLPLLKPCPHFYTGVLLTHTHTHFYTGVLLTHTFTQVWYSHTLLHRCVTDSHTHFYTGVLLTHTHAFTQVCYSHTLLHRCVTYTHTLLHRCVTHTHIFFLMKITSDRQRQDKMFLFIYAIRKARGCKQFYIKRVTVQTNSWLELCSRKPIPKDAVTTGCHSRTMRMPTVQNLDAHKDALLYKYDVYY